jgi:hypothetical protein
VPALEATLPAWALFAADIEDCAFAPGFPGRRNEVLIGDGQQRRRVIYLTQQRLMVESETAIRRGAIEGDAIPKRACGQVIADPAFYSLWRVRHNKRMLTVAERRQRDRQIVALRAVHLEQVHRTALVHYLRKEGITGATRDLTLQEFYGVMDPRRAAITEHRGYLISASSQLCAYELLKLVGDARGLALIQDYQGMYGQFFSMFCDNARAQRGNSRYLLRELIDDAKSEAQALRERILGGDLLPAAPIAIKSATLRRL